MLVTDGDWRNAVRVARIFGGQGTINVNSWSPDSRRIAFQSYISGQWQIGVVNAAGGGERTLTNSSGDNTNPTWSPDGKTIAFESTRNSQSAIYAMNADGSAQHKVS